MKTTRILGKILGLTIFVVGVIGFPVGFALYWLYVSLLPGIFPHLWPMWIGVVVTLGVCYRMAHSFFHGKSI